MARLAAFLVSVFKRCYPLVCTFLILSNFVAACSCWRSISPRHFYHTVSNTVFSVSVVTQLVDRVSLDPASALSSPAPRYEPKEYPCRDYVYYMLEGRQYVRLYGRVYSHGGLTSRGRIVGIFPDRVLLDNGDSIFDARKESRNDFGTSDTANKSAW